MAFSYAALRSWMFNISPAPAALAKRASKTLSSATVMFSRWRPPIGFGLSALIPPWLNAMCARFTVLNETPIAAAIAGCVMPLSRSNTIWIRSRCAAGSFHRKAVFSSRICRLVHLTIRPPNQMVKANHITQPNAWHPATANPRFNQLWKRYKTTVVSGYGVSVKIRRKVRADWLALMPNIHEGYVSWERAEAIRAMVSSNVPTSRHHGAPKHGNALLAGLIRCRRCGRKLTLRYSGIKHHIPRYSCSRGWMDNAEPRCIAFGGLRVDDAIENALLTIVGPGAVAAAVAAEKEAGQLRDQVREAFKRDLEAARYAADRAFRQYDAADPANRLVTGQLEARWNKALAHVAEIEGKIAAHDVAAPAVAIDHASLGLLASNLRALWSAPTTDARLKKRIVRTVIREVVADIDDAAAEIVLVVHWIGGVHSEMRLPKRRRG